MAMDSDEEEAVYANLPATEGAAEAAQRQARASPYLLLSGQHKHGRAGHDATFSAGAMSVYDDAVGRGEEGLVMPPFDLRSVAESMRQVGGRTSAACFDVLLCTDCTMDLP